MNQQALSAFICFVADLLHGDYKQSDHGKVMASCRWEQSMPSTRKNS